MSSETIPCLQVTEPSSLKTLPLVRIGQTPYHLVRVHVETKVLKGKVQSLETRVEELKEVIESKVPNYLEIYLNSTNGALAEEDDSNVEVSQ